MAVRRVKNSESEQETRKTLFAAVAHCARPFSEVTMNEQPIRLVSLKGLKERGITYSRSTINRKIKAGTFPRPVYEGDRRYWIESEINEYLVL